MTLKRKNKVLTETFFLQLSYKYFWVFKSLNEGILALLERPAVYELKRMIFFLSYVTL